MHLARFGNRSLRPLLGHSQDHRLRTGQAVGERSGTDREPNASGHSQLCGSGADERQQQGGRPPCRCSCAGCHPLRSVDGTPPFKGATVLETVQQVIHQEPVPPRLLNQAIPLILEVMCLKCLEKNPAQRYPSAAALAEDLLFGQNHEPILRGRRLRRLHELRFTRRNRALVGGAAATGLALVLGNRVLAPLRFRRGARGTAARPTGERARPRRSCARRRSTAATPWRPSARRRRRPPRHGKWPVSGRTF